jgi:hypothetical protein
MKRSVRFAIWVGFAAFLGATVGLVWAASEFVLWPVVDRTPVSPSVQGISGAGNQGEPRAVVETTVYDFGVLDEHAKGSHDFVIRNEGTAPLRIEQGSTSCRCTTSLVDQKTVPPGEKTVVTVNFDLKGFVGPYSQSATIFTNDPRNPRIVLSIRGKVTKAIQSVPTELVLTRIPANQSTTAEFRLIGYRPAPLQVSEWQFTERDNAQHFRLHLEPLPAEELSDYPGASSGILGKLTIEPGLPLGAFSQKLLLKTNYPEASQLEIPIRGTVAAEISVVAPGWDESRSLLRLGTFRRDSGLQRRFFIRVSRTLADRAAFALEKVFPEFIEVEVGSISRVGDSPAVLVPITIRFPKGCPAGNYLGLEGQPAGYILLTTGVPEAPELKINLSFLIEG